MNIGAILDKLQSTVFQDNDMPRLDAQVLLADITGKPRSWILAHPEAQLDASQKQRLSRQIAQIQAGLPLPYVIGHWEFFGLDYILTPQVLLPRPETELLVEVALAWLQNHPKYRHAADIGTGSGCIAVSLAYHLPDLHLIATDISELALQVARANVAKHGVADQVTLVQADLLPPCGGPFDLICANLPYIPSGTLQNLEIFGREPTLALDGGPDGLRLLRRLVRASPGSLVPGGILILEIEANQGKTAIELALVQFPDSQVSLVPDYAGHDRLILVQT